MGLDKMHTSTPVYLMVFIMIFSLSAFAQVPSKPFTLNPTGSSKNCVTPNNETGMCVHKSICNNDHEIEVGGRIVESEWRLASDCNRLRGEWCCSMKNIATSTTSTESPTKTTPTETPTKTPTETHTETPPLQQEKKCIATSQKDCPWCVKLYRTGDEYTYCLGAVIGANAILTTATCVLQAQTGDLWAKIPASANPEAIYPIVSRLKHPKYKSGNRLNDVALLSTESNIQWSSGGQQGTCIDPKHSLQGECIAAGVDSVENIDIMPIYITRGSCFPGGNVSDAMCGNSISLETLVAGSPIMCKKNNMYIVAGVTKLTYSNDATVALLGNLDYTWLLNNLKDKMGMNDADLLYKLNY